MDDRQFIGRFDAHIERMDAHIERMDAHIKRLDANLERLDANLERLDEGLREGREAAARHTQAVDDQRIALNQMNLRQERIIGQALAQLRRLTERTEALTKEFVEWRYDGREEDRAQRAALWAILDQLKGGGPATAAG